MVPPLQELTCFVDNDEKSVRSFGLKVRTAAELLDENPEDELYDAVEMIAFTRSLSASEKSGRGSLERLLQGDECQFFAGSNVPSDLASPI